MSLDLVLFSVSALIWGSTWYIIRFELTDVVPALSVSYRFALAALLLFAWAAFKRQPLLPDRRAWPAILATGVAMFAGNYFLVYLATGYLPSGLVAVAGATMSLANIVNARLLLRQPAPAPVLAGGLVGLVGVVLLFLPQFASLRTGALTGLALALSAAYCASLGNIFIAHTRRQEFPLLPVTAWSMTIGSSVMAAVGYTMQGRFALDLSVSYLGALLYLAVFGSVVAFLCYFTLMGRIGPGRAGYVAIMTPILALVISTVAEGYRWTVLGAVGLSLAIVGNLLTLRPPAPRPRAQPCPLQAE